MPRKKTTTDLNLDTPAEKPTTKRTPKAKSGDDGLAKELAALVGAETSLVFRPRTTPPVTTSTPAKPVVAAKESAPAAKKLGRAKPAVSEETTWSEDLPMPVFRSKESDAKPAEPRTQEARPRRERAQKPKPEPRVRPVRETEEAESPLVEFEPTATFEFDDEGEMLVVQMRGVEERTPVAAPAPRARISNPRVTEAPVKKAPEVVVKPPRALIEIPDDAPQVVLNEGQTVLVRNKRIYPNFWFYAAPTSEDRTATVIDEIKQATEAGVDIFALGFEAVCDKHHFDNLAKAVESLVSRVVKVNRDAQVVIHLDLMAPKGWEMDYQDGVYRDSTGDLAEPSISDDKYWLAVETLLRGFASGLVKSQYAPNILGIDLDRGGWVIPHSASFDISKASKVRFREWVSDRYQRDEVLLRASWFHGDISFDSVRIPDPDKNSSGAHLVRFNRRERSQVDYYLFLSDVTANRISDLAYAVKEASGGRLLIGVRYGNTFRDLRPDSGQLSLGKILRSPEIDFIAATPCVEDRGTGGAASYDAPIDSFALNSKLFVSLEDYKTSLSNRPEPEYGVPTIRTPQALESVHLRGFGGALAHQSGLCWSDNWGNGWLTAASVWQRAKDVLRVSVLGLASQFQEPDVAIFIDERALGYLVNVDAFTKLVRQTLESVGRAGVSYGLYLLSDLTHREKFPESRVYVFLNAWDIRPDLRSSIKQRLHRDNKQLLWLYAAGLFDSGRESLERAREVMGIAIKPQPIFSVSGTTLLDRRNTISQAFPHGVVGSDVSVDPTYFAVPEDGAVLGEYTQTGLPSMVVRDISVEESNHTWSSTFVGEMAVNSALLRALVQRAGAHVWSFNDDVVHVRAPFLTIHCSGDGIRTIALPGKWSAYNLLTSEWMAVDSTSFKFNSPDGVTQMFLVGTKDQIRQILEADPKRTLWMENIPARESNIRLDVSQFDVPIMRLDEWASGGEGEDDIDGWFLKPQEDDDYQEDASLAPGAPQTTRTTGRRRNRRDRDRGGRQKKPSFAEQVDFDPTGEEKLKDKGNVELSILFRKRD